MSGSADDQKTATDKHSTERGKRKEAKIIDIKNFTTVFDPILDEELNRRRGTANNAEDHLFSSYNAALEKAGVDYEKDGEQLLTEYIFPALEEMQKTYREKDEAALNIYREASHDEVKVRWRNFDTAKLSFLQKRLSTSSAPCSQALQAVS